MWGPPVSSSYHNHSRSPRSGQRQPKPRARSHDPPTPRVSAAFEEWQKPEPSRPTALIRCLLHSRSLAALVEIAAGDNRNRRTPSHRFEPSPPPFFMLVSSPPLPLPPYLFFSWNGAILRANRGAPTSSIAAGPWRVPRRTFPGRAKCPSEFALPPSSSLCTRFGQSWPGVLVPWAPTGRSWRHHEPPRKSPLRPCLWLGTDSHRSPLSPSAFGIQNHAP